MAAPLPGSMLSRAQAVRLAVAGPFGTPVDTSWRATATMGSHFSP